MGSMALVNVSRRRKPVCFYFPANSHVKVLGWWGSRPPPSPPRMRGQEKNSVVQEGEVPANWGLLTQLPGLTSPSGGETPPHPTPQPLVRHAEWAWEPAKARPLARTNQHCFQV